MSYKANKSRSQGRKSFSMTFRHPLKEYAPGKVGLKVRRGLGTDNEAAADRLVAQMNQLLANEELWNIGAIDKARALFDERVVAAFYDELGGQKPMDPWETRDLFMPLPTKEDGYAKVQLVGTTGAGKTTLLRQLIGTHPEHDRFPSTSISKTTVCDMEIILTAETDFEAVVTFFPVEKIRLYIEECVLNAGKSHVEGERRQEVIRHLLEHTEQRFRLSYLLGSPSTLTLSRVSKLVDDLDDLSDEVDDAQETPEHSASPAISQEDKIKMKETLDSFIEVIQEDSMSVYNELRGMFENEDLTEEDEEALEVLFEEQWRETATFHEIVDRIFDEVERKFDYLTAGTWEYGVREWPIYWTFHSKHREEFVSVMRQLTSNYAEYFGTLLTPLVQGIRMKGPFQPQWWEGETPKLVLMDGEGLLHQADSKTSISSKVIKSVGLADAILLVDNAKSPMLTAPIAMMKHLAASGQANKLTICFTHFDEVEGDNFLGTEDKIAHLMGTVDNAFAAISNQLGVGAERALRKQRDNIFFVAGINKVLSPRMQFTLGKLRALVSTLLSSIVPPKALETNPVYNAAMLAVPIQEASKEFHRRWDSLLGFRQDPQVKRRHWATIKALSRRLAIMNEDEFQDLRPVSDLFSSLRDNLYAFIEEPYDWTETDADAELKEASLEAVRQELSKRLFQFASVRLWLNQTDGWTRAHLRRGNGSTFERADDIRGINRRAMALQQEVTPRVFSDVLTEIFELVRESVEASGGRVISTISTTQG